MPLFALTLVGSLGLAVPLARLAFVLRLAAFSLAGMAIALVPALSRALGLIVIYWIAVWMDCGVLLCLRLNVNCISRRRLVSVIARCIASVVLSA